MTAVKKLLVAVDGSPDAVRALKFALVDQNMIPTELYRSRLEQRARFLREEIRQTLLRSDREQYLAIADQVHSAGDEAFADLMIDLNFAEIDRDVKELKEVEGALSRLAHNAFGLCESCGERVDTRRLLANPSARRCTDCESEHERRHACKTPHL